MAGLLDKWNFVAPLSMRAPLASRMAHPPLTKPAVMGSEIAVRIPLRRVFLSSVTRVEVTCGVAGAACVKAHHGKEGVWVYVVLYTGEVGEPRAPTKGLRPPISIHNRVSIQNREYLSRDVGAWASHFYDGPGVRPPLNDKRQTICG